jgi:hypothetical protein
MTMDQAVIDDAKAKIAAARDELAKANRRFHRIFNAQEKRIKAEMAKQTMTLELALTENFGDHAVSNEAGYKWLNDRCYNGEWKGLGLMVSGAWLHLNQRVLQLALKRVATDEHLDRLHAVLVDEILPVLKPGGLYDATGLLGRPSKERKQFADCRVLNIMAQDLSESHNFMLLVRPDNSAEVWDLRSWRLDTPLYKGDVRGALTVIRNNCYYEVD